MTVTYLFRCPGTGHSLEEGFSSIRRGMDRKSTWTTRSVQLPHISRDLRTVWRNLRFIARERWTGIIHITGDVHYAALALPPSQTVLTIHDCILLEKARKQPLRYGLFWLLWYYLPIRRAAVVTTVSEKTRQDLLRFVGRAAEKVVVVPNACDMAASGCAHSFNHARPVLLQMGTAPHKNLSRLIEAITGLACTLIIVGPLSGEIIRRLAKHRIAYRNYVNLSRAAIRQLYIDCDIVTFVSTYEGFGLPILEANAVGRAVITSDRSPMREVAADAAQRVDPTDTVAIRNGILRLIHDDAFRQTLVDAGYRNAQRYTLATVTAQYTMLYDRLVSNKPVMELAV